MRARLLAGLLAPMLMLGGCAGLPPTAVQDETPPRFAPCPETPNCVVSGVPGSPHEVPALRAVPGDPLASHARLLAVLGSLPEARIVEDDGRHLRTVFTSALFRFRDDVEFLVRDDGTIDLRSSSRLGLYDWGANRRRAERLQALLEEGTGP
jgi:uncharacterized protein (DUF1499 family)